MCALQAEEGFATTADGLRIYHRVSGRGPFALVMPVNWGMDSYIYTKGLSSLEFWLALVTFDPRSVGRSEPARMADEFAMSVTAQDAAAVADAIGLSRTVVIGHSSGGAVALTYALAYPERVSHLVLVSTAPRWAYEDSTGSDVSYPTSEAAMREEVRRSFHAAVREPSRFQKAFDDLLPRMRFSPERFRWAGEVEWATYDVRRELREIRAPTLIVHGRDDSVVPLEEGVQLHRGIGGSKLVVPDNCGHWPFVERRAEFVSLIRDFLGLDDGPRRRTAQS